MDLLARKYKIIEQFMQIASTEKLDKLEKFLNNEILNHKNNALPLEVKQVLDKSIEQSLVQNVKPHVQVMKEVKAKYNLD